MAIPKELGSDMFVQLILKHEWRVRAFAATMLGRSQNIEDIVQDVYAVAWEKREQFCYEADEPDEEFVRWVCTIGRYEILKNLRKQAKGGLVLDEATIERLVTFQFDENTYLDSRRRALGKCLEQLRTVDRLLIRRRYATELSVEQIAQENGKTVSATYKSFSRIRKSLMACIGRSLSQEGY